MCEELKEELARGDVAFKALAEHCKNMGADQGSQLVTIDTELYEITVKKLTNNHG